MGARAPNQPKWWLLLPVLCAGFALGHLGLRREQPPPPRAPEAAHDTPTAPSVSEVQLLRAQVAGLAAELNAPRPAPSVAAPEAPSIEQAAEPAVRGAVEPAAVQARYMHNSIVKG